MKVGFQSIKDLRITIIHLLITIFLLTAINVSVNHELIIVLSDLELRDDLSHSLDRFGSASYCRISEVKLHFPVLMCVEVGKGLAIILPRKSVFIDSLVQHFILFFFHNLKHALKEKIGAQYFHFFLYQIIFFL
jgi:hypothetical protein